MIRFGFLLLAIVPAAFAAEQAPPPRPAGPVTFDEVVAAVVEDLRTRPPGEAAVTRYLEARHLGDADRKELYKVSSYVVNSLSRGHRTYAPRPVTPWLWAVRLDNYHWAPEVWEALAAKNVYYAQPAKIVTPGVAVKKTRQVLRTNQYGQQYYATEEYTEAAPEVVKDDVITAPWLSPAAAAQFVVLTGSKTPVMRADQFLFLTLAQVDRKGHGYYDWLGLKSRADAEKLARLDRKGAEEAYRQLASIIPVSGVSPNNRQVFRYATITGGWWESRDAKTSVGNQNAQRNFLDQYKHDAEEIVFSLPNGLPGFYLSDAAGKQVDTAPDFIASDNRSTNSDKRVHVGYSCIACHQDAGLKPIRDYTRLIFGDPQTTNVSLAPSELDPVRKEQVESAYLGPLKHWYERDSGDYAVKIEELTGFKGPDLAKAVERQWAKYLDTSITLDRAAAECGVTPAELQAALRRHVQSRRGTADLVLAVFLMDDPPPVRREHFEESFGLLMFTLGGIAP